MRCYLSEGAGGGEYYECVAIRVGGGAGWRRLILLICESCQRPLEDASVSGRVTYSYNVHTEGGSDSSSGWGVVMVSYREHLFPEISLWIWTGKLIKVDTITS